MLLSSYPPVEVYQMSQFCPKVSCVMKPALHLVIYTVLTYLSRIYYRNRLYFFLQTIPLLGIVKTSWLKSDNTVCTTQTLKLWGLRWE